MAGEAPKGNFEALYAAQQELGADVGYYGADLDPSGEAGRELFRVSQIGDLEAANNLLDQGAAVNFMSYDQGKTPLMVAAENNHSAVALALIGRGTWLDCEDKKAWTALTYCCDVQNIEILEWILNMGAKSNPKDHTGKTPLMRSCLAGKASVVNRLCKAGVQVDESDNLGRTALVWTCKEGQGAKADVIKELLEGNANPNQTSVAKNCPLILCAQQKGTYFGILHLLEHKADVNKTNAHEETALFWAARIGDKDMAELLIAKKADVNLLNASGHNALDWAYAADRPNQDIIDELEDMGVLCTPDDDEDAENGDTPGGDIPDVKDLPTDDEGDDDDDEPDKGLHIGLEFELSTTEQSLEHFDKMKITFRGTAKTWMEINIGEMGELPDVGRYVFRVSEMQAFASDGLGPPDRGKWRTGYVYGGMDFAGDVGAWQAIGGVFLKCEDDDEEPEDQADDKSIASLFSGLPGDPSEPEAASDQLKVDAENAELQKRKAEDQEEEVEAAPVKREPEPPKPKPIAIPPIEMPPENIRQASVTDLFDQKYRRQSIDPYGSNFEVDRVLCVDTGFMNKLQKARKKGRRKQAKLFRFNIDKVDAKKQQEILLSFRDMVIKFMLCLDKEEGKRWLRKLKAMKVTGKTIAKLKKDKKKIRKKARKMMNKEDQEEITRKAYLKYRERMGILDQSKEFKYAVYWSISHDKDERYRDDVAALQLEDLHKILMSFTIEQLDEQYEEKKKLLHAWKYPKLGLQRYPRFKTMGAAFNVVVVGKSGHGKSSFLNTLGRHFKKEFKAKTGIQETTSVPELYSLCDTLRVYDIPGYSTQMVEGGEDGGKYIQNYSILHFDLVVIITVARDTKFAKNLYDLLRECDKKVCVVRTKCDEDVKNNKDAVVDNAMKLDAELGKYRDIMVRNLGAHPEHIFCSRNSRCKISNSYFDFPVLCGKLLKDYVEHHLNPSDPIKAIMDDFDNGIDQERIVKKHKMSEDAEAILDEMFTLKEKLDTFMGEDEKPCVKDVMDEMFGDEDSSDDDDDDEDDSIEDSSDEEKKNTDRALKEQVQETIEDIFLRQAEIRLREEIPPPYEEGDMEKFVEIMTNLLAEYEKSDVGKSSGTLVRLEKILEDKRVEIFAAIEHVAELEKRIAAQVRSDVEGTKLMDDVLTDDLKEEMQQRIAAQVQRFIEHKEQERLKEEDEQRKWILEANTDLKRAYIFGMLHSHKNDMIEQVRAIPEHKLNAKIRAIPLTSLEDKHDKEVREKFLRKWKYPPPTKFNFDGNEESRHIAIFGSWGVGKTTICQTILRAFDKIEEAANLNKYITAIAEENEDEKKDLTFEHIEETRKFQLTDNVYLWDMPGSGEAGADEGDGGEAYIRKYHAIWFSLVFIVSANRVYQLDVEMARVCHEEQRSFRFIRTKFDMDLSASFCDNGFTQEHLDEGWDWEKFRKETCGDLRGELATQLKKKGIPDEAAEKTTLYCIDGRNRSTFHFKPLLRSLKKFAAQADGTKFEVHTTEQLEEQVGHQAQSQDFLLTLVGSLGEEYQPIVDKLRDTCSDMHDLIMFNDEDFVECGIDNRCVRIKIESIITRAVAQMPGEEEMKVDISGWTPAQVMEHVMSFGHFCDPLARALEKKKIGGKILMKVPPEEILSDFEEYFVMDNPITGVAEPITGVRRRNVIRKMKRVYDKPDITEATPVLQRSNPSSPREGDSSLASIASIDYQDDNEDAGEAGGGRKLGAVFSVFKDRDYASAMDEAWQFQKKLKKNGYDLYLPGEQESIHDYPKSCEWDDFYQFMQYISDPEVQKELAGLFILIVGHGFNDNQGGLARPFIICEDELNLDILQALPSLGGTKFPVILCINSCRTDVFGRDKFKIPQMEIPSQVFLSWGSVGGEEAAEHNFVNEWRRSLGDDFETKEIQTIGAKIRRKCGGAYYDGHTSSHPCVAGVWKKNNRTLLPSDIKSNTKKQLMIKVRSFATTTSRLRKLDWDSDELKDIEKWTYFGVPQGKMILVSQEGLLAVVCLDKDAVVQGVSWRHSKDEVGLTQLKTCIDKRRLTCEANVQFFDSTVKFYAATEAGGHEEEVKAAEDGKSKSPKVGCKQQ